MLGHSSVPFSEWFSLLPSAPHIFLADLTVNVRTVFPNSDRRTCSFTQPHPHIAMAPLRHQKMRVFVHFYHRPDPCRDVTTFPVSSQPPSPGPHDWFLLPPPLFDLADMWSRPFLRTPSSMPQYAPPAIIAVSQPNHLSISTSTSDKSSIEDSKPRPTSNAGVNVASQQDAPQHPDCYLKFGWNGYDVVLQAYGRQAIVVVSLCS